MTSIFSFLERLLDMLHRSSLSDYWVLSPVSAIGHVHFYIYHMYWNHVDTKVGWVQLFHQSFGPKGFSGELMWLKNAESGRMSESKYSVTHFHPVAMEHFLFKHTCISIITPSTSPFTGTLSKFVLNPTRDWFCLNSKSVPRQFYSRRSDFPFILVLISWCLLLPDFSRLESRGRMRVCFNTDHSAQCENRGTDSLSLNIQGWWFARASCGRVFSFFQLSAYLSEGMKTPWTSHQFIASQVFYSF